VAALSGLMDIMRGSGLGAAVSVSGVGRFDGREMCMVHRMFRREFGLAASVVRQVSCGDSRRAHSVAAHLRFIGTTLHHHHGGEDRYVWPLLERRAPVQASAHVVAVMEQHRRVGVVQAAVDAELPIWSCGPSADSGERLADALERLAVVLAEHMDYEERYVVPLMEAHIGLDEWNEIVQAIREGVQRNPSDMMLVLGMMMYEGEKDVVDNTIANMRPEVRAGIRCTAALAYAEHAQYIHGSATPPTSTQLHRP